MKKTQAKKKSASGSRVAARKGATAKKAVPARTGGKKRATGAPRSASAARSTTSAPKSAKVGKVAKATKVTRPATRSPAPAPVAAVRSAPRAAGAAPALKKAAEPVYPAPRNRHFDKSAVEKAARAILKVCKPLVADDDDSDAEAQRNRLSLENAHPRRRPDGEYEVFLRYTAGSGLNDPEGEAEKHARTFFLKLAEFSGVPVAVDVNVLEERES